MGTTFSTRGETTKKEFVKLDRWDEGDSDKVRNFLNGDDRAFDPLFVKYHQMLTSFIRRKYGFPSQTIEDLVQETFVRVIRHLEGFKLQRRFSTWIHVIADNVCKNYLRDVAGKKKADRNIAFTDYYERRNSTNGFKRPNEPADIRSRTDKLLEQNILHDRLNCAIAAMQNEDQKQVLILREIENLSYLQIAEVLGINLGTVKSRLSRGKSFLRAELLKSA